MQMFFVKNEISVPGLQKPGWKKKRSFKGGAGGGGEEKLMMEASCIATFFFLLYISVGFIIKVMH